MNEDWPTQIKWYKEFAEAFRKLQPDAFTHLPALSPTGNYRAGYQAYKDAGLLKLFDWPDRHVYTLAQFIEVPAGYVITEWNQLPARTLAINGIENFYFILDSDDPDFHQYSLMRNPGLYEDFKSWARQGIVLPTDEGASTGAYSNSHDAVEGGIMLRDDRTRAFEDYKAVLDAVPMFEKVRAGHPLLGDAIGPERDYGDTRLLFCTGGIIGATIGDWANTWYVFSPHKPEDLPETL